MVQILCVDEKEASFVNQRVSIVSVYLVMLVLIVSTFKSLFPSSLNKTDAAGLDTVSSLTAVLYGMCIMSTVAYFLYLQFGVVRSDRRFNNVYDFLLVSGLFLTCLEYVFLAAFALSFPNPNSFYGVVFGHLLGFSSLLGSMLCTYIFVNGDFLNDYRIFIKSEEVNINYVDNSFGNEVLRRRK